VTLPSLVTVGLTLLARPSLPYSRCTCMHEKRVHGGTFQDDGWSVMFSLFTPHWFGTWEVESELISHSNPVDEMFDSIIPGAADPMTIWHIIVLATLRTSWMPRALLRDICIYARIELNHLLNVYMCKWKTKKTLVGWIYIVYEIMDDMSIW
jgi:hypothetical protein